MLGEKEEMEDIKCIFCDVDDSRVVIEENGYKGRQCSQCGLIYVSPRPSFNEIVDLYRHDDASVSAGSHIAAGFAKRLLARHHLRLMSSVVRGGTLLEIGAGAGYFLDEARKVGFDPYGIEFNPVQASFIRDKLRIPCQESTLSTSVFEGKRFDVVYHCDVVSHFYDPISEFRRINGVMKEGAYLVFETGNLGEVGQEYFKYFQRFQYPDHLFFFSTDSLRKLLERTGFKVLRMHRYSIVPQLLALRAFAGIRGLLFKSGKQERLSGDGGREREPAEDISQSSSRHSSVKKAIGTVWGYANHLLRYKAGYIVPKKRRPQTVVVVAQKIGLVVERMDVATADEAIVERSGGLDHTE